MVQNSGANWTYQRRCQGLKKNNLPRQLGPVNKFSGAVAGEEEDFCKGSLARTIFTLLLFCFILFLLASYYQKYKKN
jgi:hypothetical protein